MSDKTPKVRNLDAPDDVTRKNWKAGWKEISGGTSFRGYDTVSHLNGHMPTSPWLARILRWVDLDTPPLGDHKHLSAPSAAMDVGASINQCRDRVTHGTLSLRM